MPRVTVTTTDLPSPRGSAVLLDEEVHSVHLSTDHASGQFVERLGWAIRDAEEAERTSARPVRPQTRS